MSSGSRGAAAALVLLLGAAAFAQDGPDDERAVTDEMVQTCPDLKTAKGRVKSQLLALFFDLDWRKASEPATEKRVRATFDLAKKEDTDLLEKHLATKGAYRCQGGVRAVVAAEGAPGLLWALRVFEKGVVQVRGRALDALSAVRFKEALRLLVRALDDKTPVPDWKAAQESPPGYTDLRVCDHALRTLAGRLENLEGLTLPKAVNGGRGGPLTTVESRDAQVAALKQFVAGDAQYAALLKKAPSAMDGLDGAAKKEAKETFERLGVAGE